MIWQDMGSTIINQSINQSINWYLLTCKLNSKSAYYKASTKKKQIHKQHIIQTLNKQTNEYNIILQEKIYKSTGAKPLHSEETQIS
jgi:hypothetical protein